MEEGKGEIKVMTLFWGLKKRNLPPNKNRAGFTKYNPKVYWLSVQVWH